RPGGLPAAPGGAAGRPPRPEEGRRLAEGQPAAKRAVVHEVAEHQQGPLHQPRRHRLRAAGAEGVRVIVATSGAACGFAEPGAALSRREIVADKRIPFVLVLLALLAAPWGLPAQEKEDIRAQDLRAGKDEKKRYFLIGPRKGARAPRAGYGLVV